MPEVIFHIIEPTGRLRASEAVRWPVMARLVKQSGASMLVQPLDIVNAPVGREVVMPAYMLTDLTEDQKAVLKEKHPSPGHKLLAFLEAGDCREWLDGIDKTDRYECSAWFERDRQSLTLTDKITNANVFALWDDDVTDAIDSGYLSRPRVPRPDDSDWLEPAITYAEDCGLLETQKKASRSRERSTA